MVTTRNMETGLQLSLSMTKQGFTWPQLLTGTPTFSLIHQLSPLIHGTTLKYHKFLLGLRYFKNKWYWRECLRCSQLSFKRSAGNNNSGHYFCHYFLFTCFLSNFFFSTSTFLTEIKKLIFLKLTRTNSFPDPVGHFQPPGTVGQVYRFQLWRFK